MPRHYTLENSGALAAMLEVKNLADSVPKPLKALIELRVSQINGCSYCIDLHGREAVELGVAAAKVDALDDAEASGLYDASEMAAIKWAEALTRVSNGLAREAHHAELNQHYSDREIADLTYIIANMNALNRMAIGYGDKPAKA